MLNGEAIVWDFKVYYPDPKYLSHSFSIKHDLRKQCKIEKGNEHIPFQAVELRRTLSKADQTFKKLEKVRQRVGKMTRKGEANLKKKKILNNALCWKPR